MQDTTRPVHTEPLTSYRKSLLNRVHVAAAKVGLEGDGYRLALLGLAGSKTAITLTNAQLVEAIKDFESLAPAQDNSAEALKGLLAW